ncbi:MAG TPA: sugar phosphate isomerase/epimerase family protein [Puia sp.]|nr:sugar phosphate isomerase/epimerase family protein [Puia sp.]
MKHKKQRHHGYDAKDGDNAPGNLGYDAKDRDNTPGNRRYDRRDFLKTATALLPLSVLAGLPASAASAGRQSATPLLSFSTLGCPDWTYGRILDFAAANGYAGLEIRGIQRQLDLSQSPHFNSPANILTTRTMAEDKGLRFVDLGSSAEMHHPEGPVRQKNMDEVRRFIDLAHELHCPYIRVFPNNLPEDQDRDATIGLIIQGLLESGKYAEGGDVTVLMESHGELTHSRDLEKIMRSARHPHVGLVWDIVNMWSATKESPAEVYPVLKDYIRHTHIKDLRFVDGKEQYVLLGKGEAPIFEGIDALVKGGYKGYYSFEWEKLWHPEIGDPEIALADYPVAMRKHFKQ